MWGMARRLVFPLTVVHVAAVVALFLCLAPGRVSTRLSYCPRECDCQGFTLNCDHRGLMMVPRNLPPEARRINLEGNNISVIRGDDFRGLKKLKILQLMDNGIQLIEKGALRDLMALERLRLNNNNLKSLPESMFSNTPNLQRLQLDNNEITCIDDSAIRSLKGMEILTLNQNNFTSLGKNIFESMKRLRVLRLSENPFICDCHLSWLASWLRRNPLLGLFSQCALPTYLWKKSIAEMHETDFQCSGVDDLSSRGCSREHACPFHCSCYEGVVDCRDKGLTKVPEPIPETAVELRLEQNKISELPPRAFVNYRRLKRIDLSNNDITKIAGDAFTGLKALTSLVLYGNKITDLPEGLFQGLTSLQLLLLNANKIQCVRRSAFSDLHNLNLLSLYDNNIQALANGTLDSLENIQTLHLARNPFICDCNLRWLAEYLHANPIETSGAKCEGPKRMHRRRISQMREHKFKCKGSEEHRTLRAGECLIDKDCPESCVCEGTIIDCSRRRLKDIPTDIPMFATELRLNDNMIMKVRNDALFKKLPNLNKLDLRNNEISEIEDGAFHGAVALTDLLLTENKLRQLRPKMFSGLTKITTLMLQTNQINCITNDTFADLGTLRLLSLYDNRIRCIMTGTFDRMRALTTLNVLGNPLNCNCHLRWFSDWLKKQTIVTGNPRCQIPASLRDIPVQDVEHKDFVCNEQELHDTCGPNDLCPAGCTCTGTIIHCSRQKLKDIPKNLPLTSTELYVDVNEISVIPYELNLLKEIQRLDFSNNQITILPNNIFSNLTKLSTLILSYNKLQCLQVNSFRGLQSLRILSLHGNDISLVPDGAFLDLSSITHIALGANPLFCDCNLRWLSDWIKQDYIEPGIARCAEPRAMKDKLVLTAPSDEFVCEGKPEPDVLAKCDACFTFPCEHGGTCISKPLRKYECECKPEFHGKHCEYTIDACFGYPCENRGTCKVLEAGRFSCHCPTGFEGDRCETNINDCVAHKCENNATCIDNIQFYDCLCLPGYTGNYCEKKINFCSREFDPCKNGATCIDQTTHYSCACSVGFSGENCSSNIDDCTDHICQNGGTCVDQVNSYTCECPKGFAGSFCELAPMVAMLYPQTSPCQHHDCKHGVCFQPSGAADYICKCSPGFTGKRCESLSSVSFRHGSFLEFEPLNTMPGANITINFVTKQEFGVMIYNGESQHLAVELFRGRIRVSFDIGNHPVSTMFSYETVSDGNYHEVEFILIKKNFTMRVDGGIARTIVNEGSREFLEVKSPLYIGGVIEDVGGSAVKHWHLWNASSFEGCMKEMFVNGRPLDIMVAKKQQRVAPGCVDYEDPKPCKSHLCQKGQCFPLNKFSYECRCYKGWSGPFCDQAPTCQKEQYREYLEENGCRSTKKLKKAQCLGSCGDQCCKPLRTKSRNIRMECPDGTRYTTTIKIVRKCKCSQKC